MCKVNIAQKEKKKDVVTGVKYVVLWDIKEIMNSGQNMKTKRKKKDAELGCESVSCRC